MHGVIGDPLFVYGFALLLLRETVENIALSYLRAFRADFDVVKQEVTSLKFRLSAIDQRIAISQFELAHAHERQNKTDKRMARLERRLEIRDRED